MTDVKHNVKEFNYEGVREAPGGEEGDSARYVISEGGVQVLRTRSVSELAGMLTRDGRVSVSLNDMQEIIVHAATESGKLKNLNQAPLWVRHLIAVKG